jgi:hypothetical protein
MRDRHVAVLLSVLRGRVHAPDAASQLGLKASTVGNYVRQLRATRAHRAAALRRQRFVQRFVGPIGVRSVLVDSVATITRPGEPPLSTTVKVIKYEYFRPQVWG